jgi:hypothetical protein
MTSIATGSTRTGTGDGRAPIDARARHRPGRLGAAALALLLTAACGGSDAPTEPPIIDPPVVLPPLVGTWVGSIDGSYGPGSFSLVLRADSTMSGSSNNTNYCPLVGATWTVASGQFIGTGRDCNSIVVTLTAPIAVLRLNGTWSASSGRSGTFTVARP